MYSGGCQTGEYSAGGAVQLVGGPGGQKGRGQGCHWSPSGNSEQNPAPPHPLTASELHPLPPHTAGWEGLRRAGLPWEGRSQGGPSGLAGSAFDVVQAWAPLAGRPGWARAQGRVGPACGPGPSDRAGSDRGGACGPWKRPGTLVGSARTKVRGAGGTGERGLWPLLQGAHGNAELPVSDPRTPRGQYLTPTPGVSGRTPSSRSPTSSPCACFFRRRVDTILRGGRRRCP